MKLISTEQPPCSSLPVHAVARSAPGISPAARLPHLLRVEQLVVRRDGGRLIGTGLLCLLVSHFVLSSWGP